MATTTDRTLCRQLETLFQHGTVADLTDGQLLERFARGTGPAAELAFAELVERHGAMILRVCRARLNDPHEVQDAFQATFLVLIEKARGLWVRDSLGPWLHQVALRTASCARSSAIRRRRLERAAAEGTMEGRDHRDHPDRPDDPELACALHEEIDRLPEHFRIPIVLCDLEGRTCEEAARVMGRPVGSIKCWRSRGRDRLRRRLMRRGLALGAAIEAVLASDIARASVATASSSTSIPALWATRIVADWTVAGKVPPAMSAMVKGVLESMMIEKFRTTATTLCAATALCVGLAVAARVPGGAMDDPPAASPSRPTASSKSPPATPKSSEARQEVWPLSLRDAIWIGLDNSDRVRVIRVGTQVRATGGQPEREGAIAPLSADVDVQEFRAAVMTRVRAIEQQYWNLAMAHVQLWAAEQAVSITSDLLTSEHARLKVGRGDGANVAEISQRLEQFNLDLVTRTSDLITAERRLRELMGVPPADNRRIMPITEPVDSKISPDWQQSLAAMIENHPEVVRARRQAERTNGQGATAAELQQVAGAFLPGLGSPGGSVKSTGVALPPGAPATREAARWKQVVHQATHSLARFFLEVDANYKQYQTAARLRSAAAQRVETERDRFNKGEHTVDRLLDAVSQYATSVSTEAQYKAFYASSLICLEEAKGTLLDHEDIAVAQAARGASEPSGSTTSISGPVAISSAHDASALGLRHVDPGEPDSGRPAAPAPPTALVPTPPATALGPAPPATERPTANSVVPVSVPPPGAPIAASEDTKPAPAGKTYSFQLTISAGPKPVEIRGSFTVAPGHDGR